MEFIHLDRVFWTIMSVHFPRGSKETFPHSILQFLMLYDHFPSSIQVLITLGFVAAERSLQNHPWNCSLLSRSVSACKPPGNAGIETWHSTLPIFQRGHLFSSLRVVYVTLQSLELIMWPLELNPHWLIKKHKAVGYAWFYLSKLREPTGILFLNLLSPLLCFLSG